MIEFKSFSKQVTGLTSKTTEENRSKLRQEVIDFINEEVKEENVISITEATPATSILTITVWYRK
ncbi:MAG: hypothetical protein JXA33_29720 [Anaerolineae bacterium]|nr:hypothetical protein [Anaerolineae bacterium]